MKQKWLALLCALVLCCLLPLEGLAVRRGQVVRITNSGSVNVRKGPGTSYGSIGSAQPENIYPYLGTENGWHKIRFTLGAEGYVSANKSTVEDGLVPDEIGNGEKVNAVVRITHNASLNIRSGPGKVFGVISTAYPNETYPYIGPDDGWNIIQLANGEYGYVAANRSAVEIIDEPVSNGGFDEMNGSNIEGTSGATEGTSGATQETTPSTMPCGQCSGTGVCTTCDGFTVIYDANQRMLTTCLSCLGTVKCWMCNGTGVN